MDGRVSLSSAIVTCVAKCVKAGFCLAYALLNVLRTVGDVADRVSSRRLVDALPIVDGSMLAEVLSESFGFLEGEGVWSSVEIGACP